MCLFEFSALREPEATQFPKIGAWLRKKGVEFNEVPTPQMLWKGALWPDLYIANQLDAVPSDFWIPQYVQAPQIPKQEWANDLPLEVVSLWQHGAQFHDEFIEPMCRKITGRSSSEIAAKYHRSIWLPLYWPETLRARASIRTPFFYPAEGFSGIVARALEGTISALDSGSEKRVASENARQSNLDIHVISTAYVIGKPLERFSVTFVVDKSPIYRVTDLDVCAGLSPEFHRFVVEYRGECNVAQELGRLGLTYHPRHMAFGSMTMTLPTIRNVKDGWRPRPHLNAQLLEIMNDEQA